MLHNIVFNVLSDNKNCSYKLLSKYRSAAPHIILHIVVFLCLTNYTDDLTTTVNGIQLNKYDVSNQIKSNQISDQSHQKLMLGPIKKCEQVFSLKKDFKINLFNIYLLKCC